MDGLADYSDSDGDDSVVGTGGDAPVGANVVVSNGSSGNNNNSSNNSGALNSDNSDGALNGLVANYSDSDDEGDSSNNNNYHIVDGPSAAKRQKLAASTTATTAATTAAATTTGTTMKRVPLSPSSKKALDASIASIRSSIAEGKGEHSQSPQSKPRQTITSVTENTPLTLRKKTKMSKAI